MQPAAQDIDSAHRPLFDNDGLNALFVMARRHQHLTLNVFVVSGRHDHLLPIANIMGRLDEHFFTSDIAMVSIVIDDILRFKSIRHPRMHFTVFGHRSDPDVIAFGAIHWLDPNPIHVIDDDWRTWRRINGHIHADIGKVRMSAGHRRDESENSRAGGRGEKLTQTGR
jgi:hypothetical protein